MTRSAIQDWATAGLKATAAVAFRVYGRANYEAEWHEIDVVASHRRDSNSRWPLWRGCCITWTGTLVAVGWDFAASVAAEQAVAPATCDNPMCVPSGRLGNRPNSCSAILAHECGHAAQARRMGFLYWPLVGSVTLLREGPHWWQRFENEASETGEFGGILPGTIHPKLL